MLISTVSATLRFDNIMASTTPTSSSSGFAPATTQAPLFPLFIFNARPSSLDASLISAGLAPDDHESRSLHRFQVACPTGANDADAQCSSANLFPAEIYHTQGSLYGGTFRQAARAATTWQCELGSSSDDDDASSIYGTCSQWSGNGNTTSTTSLDTCYVSRHSVPVRITAGAGKETYYQFSTWSAEQYNSAVVSGLEEKGCPNPTSLVDPGAVTGSISISESTGQTTGPENTGTTASVTQTAPAPSSTPAASQSATSASIGQASTTLKIIYVFMATLSFVALGL